MSNEASTPKLLAHHAFIEWTTPGGLRVAYYAMPLERIPCDFYADPDGRWTYEELVRAARFAASDVAIGALSDDFNGHPAGSAVVTLNSADRPYVAIIECPVAYVYAGDEEAVRVA
ncbi:MAG TPA: hypothetical protein VFZ53_29035 [Polyangiaceae bacterium]